MIYVTFTILGERYAVRCDSEETAKSVYHDAAFDRWYKNVHIRRSGKPRRCTVLTLKEYDNM